MAKSREVYIDVENLKLGLYALEDTTKAPFGSARIMKNVMVTDRGGIGPRPGTQLIGTKNTAAFGLKGLYNFRSSFSAEEMLIKTYSDRVEAYSKNYGGDWSLVKAGFTSDKEFGFVTALVDTDNQDYVLYCNRYDPYQVWTGAAAKLTTDLVGSETSIPVDSVLLSEIYYNQKVDTVTSSTATTITVQGSPWATDAFKGNYVRITSGTYTGKIRKISGNTGNVVTFATLPSSPGLVSFEIRKMKFPDTGSLLIGGNIVPYTGAGTDGSFTVVSAVPASANTLVFNVSVDYPALPRGNRLANYLSRIVVGRVRSAQAYGSGGALQGYNAGGSLFVSKIKSPYNFSFDANRIAGQGDIISMPYGGGEVTDVVAQESSVYAFKDSYIESIQYTQDSFDIAQRTPLKQGVGSVGRVIKGADDLYFMTKDGKFTSIGRVETKDALPQTENIGYSIKRILDTYVFDNMNGIEHKNRLLIPGKSSADVTVNDTMLVYNKLTKSFEGIWDIGAFGMESFNDMLVYGQSDTPNVYEMFVGRADVTGSTRLPIVSSYATHFMNLTPSKSNQQSLCSLYFEGYIRPGTKMNFEAWKSFSNTPFLQFSFQGSESGLLDGSAFTAAMGLTPLGLNPLGSYGAVDSDGRRHFQFRVYFPWQYSNFFSIGWGSNLADDDWEITRYGLELGEDVSTDTSRIKNI